jgi:hypothetical protein
MGVSVDTADAKCGETYREGSHRAYENSMKMNFAYFGHSPGGAPDKRKHGLFSTDDSESKPAKLPVSSK